MIVFFHFSFSCALIVLFGLASQGRGSPQPSDAEGNYAALLPYCDAIFGSQPAEYAAMPQVGRAALHVARLRAADLASQGRKFFN
jgi:hypothetical protein